MPLLWEEESTSWGNSAQTAKTLYWKRVSVLLKCKAREEQVVDLTVRILSDSPRHNQETRILRIQLSSENNLHFLHTLDVSEEDFQSLKTKNGILVDFGNFPGKVIDLLEKCIKASDDDKPRFQTELAVDGCESELRIVETNDFNMLMHLKLDLRPGNDSTIKQFLAFRLSEMSANNEKLTDELQAAQTESECMAERLQRCEDTLSRVREEYERCRLEMEAHSHTQQAAAEEEKAREKSEQKEQLERMWEEKEQKLREHLAVANKRNEELDTENRKLRKEKYDLDTKFCELSHRCATTEGYKTSLQEEAERLKSENITLSQKCHDLEIKFKECEGKNVALGEKIRDKDAFIEEQKGRMREVENSSAGSNSRCVELKREIERHGEQAHEKDKDLQKSHEIIQTFASQLRLSKEKYQVCHAALMRKQEVTDQQAHALAKGEEKRKKLEFQLDERERENERLRGDACRMKDLIEKNRIDLQRNEEMIKWLNQQTNDAQLKSSGRLASSHFQPTFSLRNSSAHMKLSAKTSKDAGIILHAESMTGSPTKLDLLRSAGTSGLNNSSAPRTGSYRAGGSNML